MRPVFEVADVIKALGSDIEQAGLNTHQLRTLRAIEQCRTPVLGGHVDACTDCGTIHISYNSCRNRHCPSPRWILQKVSQSVFNINFSIT